VTLAPFHFLAGGMNGAMTAHSASVVLLA
jgi:hypothetical protein